eukprot:1159641-Pelagomonas_calceolata.AAC.14
MKREAQDAGAIKRGARAQVHRLPEQCQNGFNTLSTGAHIARAVPEWMDDEPREERKNVDGRRVGVEGFNTLSTGAHIARTIPERPQHMTDMVRPSTT